jgi:hypothetical protein
MTKTDRRREQAEIEREAAEDPRPGDRHVPVSDRCPARLGGSHNVTLRGNDGLYRCWYCRKTRAEIKAEQRA